MRMKRVIGLILALGVVATMISCKPDADIMQKADGGYVVNTTKLSKDVYGYEWTTPVKIYITDNKITKVETLPNHETPHYFARVKTHLLPQWNGMEVSRALKDDVDGVTGATYSSKAVKENVRLGLEYYKKHKRR
ncbi:MAG: FMN-binding protein [Bacteroidaceae bacterium]|nr:FMN-binding protein [Bacteroidaceae bacterium]